MQDFVAPILPPKVYDGVRRVLIEARGNVYDSLKNRYRKLPGDWVRANIFRPWPSSTPGGYILRIYPGLHLNMNHQPELGITFEPRRGATGKVFESGQALVTQRIASSSTGWDKVFRLTSKHASIVHPDLQWIISMPLKTGRGRPIGVMNIDGLHKQFKIDVLYKCMEDVTDEAVIISHLLARR